MSSKDFLTDYLECESIIAALNNNSLFAYPKSGFVRISRDWNKRSYFLELFKEINAKSSNAILKININNDIIKHEYTSTKIIITTIRGILRLKFSEISQTNRASFEEKFKFAIEDPDLNGDCEIKIDLDKKLKGPRLNKICQNKEEINNKIAKNNREDVINILTDNSENIEEKSLFEIRKKEEVKALVLNKAESLIKNNVISKNTFYSPNVYFQSRTSQVLNDLDVFEPSFTKNSTNNKRLRKNIENDENKNNLKTPKRNKKESVYDQENIENCGLSSSKVLTRKWNRSSSSLSKSCGKGFSNLGNTCYMNAILQCLLNIDIFSNELIINYEKVKIDLENSPADQPKKKQMNKECLYFCLCELIMAREQRNESLQVKCLKEIKDSISKEAFRFSGFSQQDAHEFLCQVLDQLNDDFENLNKFENNDSLDSKNMISNHEKKNKDEHSVSESKEKEISDKTNAETNERLKSDETLFIDKSEKNECDHFLSETRVLNNKSELQKTEAQKEKKINGDNKRERGKKEIEVLNLSNEKIEEEAKKINIETQINNDKKNSEKNINTTTANNTFLTNPIVDNFEFQVNHQIKCKKCSNIINKSEDYNNLCLDLPVNAQSNENTELTLQDTLNIFFRDENLTDFKCDKCDSIGEVFIQRKISELPRILILHLKRYQFQEIQIENDMEAIYNEVETIETTEGNKIRHKLVKNDTFIKIPRYLNLTSLLCNDEKVKLPKPLPKTTQIKLEKKLFSIDKKSETITPLKRIPFKQHTINLNDKTSSYDNNMTPRTKKIGNLCEYKTILSPLDINSSSLLQNFRSPLANIKSKLNIKPSHNLRNSNKTSSIETDSESLPDLESNNKTSIENYDQSNFYIENLSEEDQMKRAFEESLVSDLNLPAKIDKNYTIPKLFNLDGNFDVDYDAFSAVEFDENEKRKSSDSELDKDFIPKKKSKKPLTTYERNEPKKRYLIKNKKKDSIKSKNKKNEEIIIDSEASQEAADKNEADEDEQTKQAIAESLETFRSGEEKAELAIAESMKLFHSENNHNESFPNPTIEDSPQQAKAKINNSHRSNDLTEETDNLNSYRIIGIVNHLGVSSNSGHYISDVYNIKKDTWSSYDDKIVNNLNEQDVLRKRSKTGYIFFYIHKSLEKLPQTKNPQTKIHTAPAFEG